LRGHLASLSGKRVAAAGQLLILNSLVLQLTLTIDQVQVHLCVGGERVSDKLGIPVQTFFILFFCIFCISSGSAVKTPTREGSVRFIERSSR
jgi:hypothetical protein